MGLTARVNSRARGLRRARKAADRRTDRPAGQDRVTVANTNRRPEGQVLVEARMGWIVAAALYLTGVLAMASFACSQERRWDAPSALAWGMSMAAWPLGVLYVAARELRRGR